MPSMLAGEVSSILGFNVVSIHGEYLGLPTEFGRSKKFLFNNVIERVQSKLARWKESLLSVARKEVLLKSVTTSIPLYPISLFLLPQSICNKLNKLLRHLWWKDKSNKGDFWVSWSKLCRSKSLGGLGSRDFQSFNLALLARQCWCLLSNEKALWVKVFKGKYFPNSSFLDVPNHHSCSCAWRSLMKGRSLLLNGLHRRVGDGKSTSIFYDAWVPSLPGEKLTGNYPSFHIHLVEDLIINPSRQWNLPLIQSSFSASDAQAILQIFSSQACQWILLLLLLMGLGTQRQRNEEEEQSFLIKESLSLELSVRQAGDFQLQLWR